MSDIYVVVPVGWVPPPAHTTWQGAAEELSNHKGDQKLMEVVNIELIEED